MEKKGIGILLVAGTLVGADLADEQPHVEPVIKPDYVVLDPELSQIPATADQSLGQPQVDISGDLISFRLENGQMVRRPMRK